LTQIQGAWRRDVIWYSDYARGYLGRFDTKTGDVKEFASPGGTNSLPYGIVYHNHCAEAPEEQNERNIMGKSGSQNGRSPSQLIDERISELGDWRGKMLAQLRALIKQADPEVIEEWKWRGVPVWYHDGMICTGETYRNVVKMTFAKGAALDDPSGLFNSSLDGNTRRAIDFHEGETIDEEPLKALVRAAVTLNASRAHG
jgi:hypothetical protein